MAPFYEHQQQQQQHQHTSYPLSPTRSQNESYGAKSPRPILKTPTRSQNEPYGAKSPRPILKTSESPSSSLDSSCQRCARFSTNIDVKVIPEFPTEEFSTFFYDDDELAKFRNDAFMEACGLDPNDFD
jgi:hypothetical protein